MEINYSQSEIKEMDFSKSLSGYKKSEVNMFLQEIAEQTDAMQKQISRLQDKIETQNKQLDKIEEQKNLLKRTLVLAEKLKDETLANAKSEANNIIKDAEISSRKKIQKAKDYLSILEHELINLKEQKKQFASKFKIQLKTMLENIEQFQQEKSDEEAAPETYKKHMPETDSNDKEQNPPKEEIAEKNPSQDFDSTSPESENDVDKE